MNDEGLLRAYAREGNEQAFTELVRRYAALVYGTALRHVHDPLAAEEVSQKSFCALATQASSIKKPSHLPAWLYETTRRLAAMHVRTDMRRVAREQIAAGMTTNDTTSSETWELIEPLLNQGLDDLAEKDRIAILLRFFRGMSMAEVAEGLGTSEAAAKMRVGRAVEKLRTFFSRHGIACSGAALLVLLEHHASAQPPTAVLASLLDHLSLLRATHQVAPRISKDVGLRSRWSLSLAVGVALLALLITSSNGFWTHSRVKTDAAVDKTLADQPPMVAPAPDQIASQKTPARANRIQLTILDEKTSAPLFGVRVKASQLTRPVAETVIDLLGEAVTDQDGHCELPGPTSDGGDFYYRLRADHDGYASMRVSWSRHQHDDITDVPTSFELKMTRGISIGGFITDEADFPLTGIELILQSSSIYNSLPPRTRPLLNDGTAETITTDGQGKWSFDRLPMHWENIRFIVNHRAFLHAEYLCDASDFRMDNQFPLPKDDLLGMRAKMVLKRGLLITGQVVDQSEKTISGVRVVQSFDWVQDHVGTTSDEGGIYRFLNAPTGKLTLCFQAEHYSPQTVNLVVNGPTTNPPVVLSPGHLLSGHVVDDAGLPVESAAVELSEDAGHQHEFQFHATTDARGAFFWDGAPNASVKLGLLKTGFQSTNVTVAVDGSDQSITLHRIDESWLRLQGQVSDDQTGLPVPKFNFYIYEGHEERAAPKEGSDGKFSAWIQAKSTPFKIEVRADGYQSATSDFGPATDGNQAVAFKLHPTLDYDGMVRTPEGEPAAGAEVALVVSQQGAILGKRKFMFLDEIPHQVADTQGRFHFNALNDAKVLIAVHQLGYGELDISKLNAGNRVIQLQPWGRVEGIVHSAGKPLPNERVSLSKRHWNPWITGILLYPEPFTVTTDHEGRFAFEDVPPGFHGLARVVTNGFLEKRATLQVNPGETTQIELGGKGHPVIGKIHAEKYDSGFDFSGSSGELRIIRPHPADLPNLARRQDFATFEAYEQASQLDGIRRETYWQSAEGLTAWYEELSYAIWFEKDGTLHADDVPPGEYYFRMQVRIRDLVDGRLRIREVGPLHGRATVPEPSALNSGQAADVGTIELESGWF